MDDLTRRLNDLPNTKYYFYADDIATITSGKNKVKLVTSTIEEWFALNDMTLNYKKAESYSWGSVCQKLCCLKFKRIKNPTAFRNILRLIIINT